MEIMKAEYIRALLRLTRVSSADVVNATIDHLCCGDTQVDAARVHSVQQGDIARMVKRLRELDDIVTQAAIEKLRSDNL